MRGIVIPTLLGSKPFVIDLGPNQLQTFYKVIDCRCIDIVELDEDNAIAIDCVIDDEGLLASKPINQYWGRSYLFGCCDMPLFGITVITMTDLSTGETIDINLSKVRRILVEKFGFTESELIDCNDNQYWEFKDGELKRKQVLLEDKYVD